MMNDLGVEIVILGLFGVVIVALIMAVLEYFEVRSVTNDKSLSSREKIDELRKRGYM
jgi:hypothetical protein